MATATSQPTNNPQTINLSKIECIPPKNTMATINQFILNTTDFINRFAFYSEEKLLNLDENIEKLETQLILLEKKLETIPSEYFANINTQVSVASNNLPPETNNNNNNNNAGGTPPPPPPPPPPVINVQQGPTGGGPPPPPPPPLSLLLGNAASGIKTTLPPPPVINNASNVNPNPGATEQQGTNTQGTGEEVKQEEKKSEFPEEYKKYKRLFDIGIPYQQFKPKMIAEGLDFSVFEGLVDLNRPPNT